ncbi:hypothetical protein CsSME_00024620 [Camellia sinensis var. sinensis]
MEDLHRRLEFCGCGSRADRPPLILTNPPCPLGSLFAAAPNKKNFANPSPSPSLNLNLKSLIPTTQSFIISSISRRSRSSNGRQSTASCERRSNSYH